MRNRGPRPARLPRRGAVRRRRLRTRPSPGAAPGSAPRRARTRSVRATRRLGRRAASTSTRLDPTYLSISANSVSTSCSCGTLRSASPRLNTSPSLPGSGGQHGPRFSRGQHGKPASAASPRSPVGCAPAARALASSARASDRHHAGPSRPAGALASPSVVTARMLAAALELDERLTARRLAVARPGVGGSRSSPS